MYQRHSRLLRRLREGHRRLLPRPRGPPPLTKGTISVSTTQSFSGTNAVKCTTTASTDDADVYRQALMRITTQDAPITGNNFFGRMMIWFGTVPPNNGLHWSNIEASGTVTTETYNDAPYSSSYNYGGQYSHFMGNYNTSGGPATDCWQHSTTIPVHRRRGTASSGNTTAQTTPCASGSTARRSMPSPW